MSSSGAPNPKFAGRIAPRAVVLARGLGSRMRAADSSAALTPEQARIADAGLKAMMPINGHVFLDYVLSALADAGIPDVGLVVAPDHEMLRRHFAHSRPVRVHTTFVVQDEALGTANAVLAAETWVGKTPFLAMNADNLYPSSALADLAALDEPGLAAFDRDNLVRTSNIPADRIRAFALVELDDRDYVTRILEKPTAAPTKGADMLVSMNCWRFDSRIFAACRDVDRSARGELELPEAVALAIHRGVRFKAIRARGPVLDLSRRADAADVERRLAHVVPHP